MSEPLTQPEEPEVLDSDPEVAPETPPEEPPAAEPPVEDPQAELLAKLDSIQQELETEKGRRADTQRDWQAAQHELAFKQTLTEDIAQELERRRQAEEWLRLNSQPPEVEDPDELLSDGKKLVEWQTKREEALAQRLLAQQAPFMQAVSYFDQVFPQLVQGMQKEAYEKAEAWLIENDEGYEAGDLQKAWDPINKAFTGSPNGASLRLQADSIVDAYKMISRRSRSKPAASPRAPVSAGQGDKRPSKGARTPAMPAKFREMAVKMNRDPDKLWKRHLASKGAAA
jgi:hypothetical protein